MRRPPTDFEDHFKDFPPEVHQRLQTLRSTIQELVPEATEAISYAIPTFKLKGKNLVHFAAFKKHIGFFPGAKAIEVFAPQLAGYKTSKGTLQLPLNQPLPLDLIKAMVEFCHSRVLSAATTSRRRTHPDLNPSSAKPPQPPPSSASPR